MNTTMIINSIVLTNLILTCIGLPLIIKALIEVRGLMNSTHKIQYVPMEQELARVQAEVEGLKPEEAAKVAKHLSNENDNFMDYQEF